LTAGIAKRNSDLAPILHDKDYYQPSLDSEQEQAVTRASGDASNRVQNPGGCHDFVADLLLRASGPYSGDVPFTMNQLAVAAASASYYNGSLSPLQVIYDGKSTTLAALLYNKSNILAITDTGSSGVAYIGLNESFFSRANRLSRPAILIHEWVHGINSQFLTDKYLAGILGWDGKGGQESASQYLTNQFQANCGSGNGGRGIR
jgi:hypothetical protein